MFRRKQQPKPLPFEPYRPPQPPATIDHEPQLSAAQRQTYDWSEPDAPVLPAKRPATYVPAASDILPAPTINLANPNVGIEAQVTPYATVEGKTFGSHSDRARAWTRYSLPLCAAFGVVTTAAAIGLYGVPLLSWAAFITFWVTFVAAYVVLLRLYWQHTPEGVALTNSRELWRYFKRDQKHRHTIERQQYQDQRERNQQRLGGGQ